MKALETFRGRLAAESERLQAEGISNVAKPVEQLGRRAEELAGTAGHKLSLLRELADYAAEQADEAPDETFDAWDALSLFVGTELQGDEVFKDPRLLTWIASLQDYLVTIRAADGRHLVGKSSSLADIVRTVFRELSGGGQDNYRVPSSRAGVAQTLMQFQNSHRPHDL